MKRRRVGIVGTRRIDSLAGHDPYARLDVVDAPPPPHASALDPGLALPGASVHHPRAAALHLAAHPVLRDLDRRGVPRYLNRPQIEGEGERPLDLGERL